MWTKGRVDVLGGLFVDNEASDKGGVVIAGDDSTTILAGGVFERNSAIEGGVVYVGDGSNLSVGSGTFYKNEASNTGGVFSVSDGGNLKVRERMFQLFGPCSVSVRLHTCGFGIRPTRSNCWPATSFVIGCHSPQSGFWNFAALV